MPSNSELESLQPILEAAGCNGPYDEIHRCSAMHCDHCGVCNIVPDLLAWRNREVEEAFMWEQYSGDYEKQYYDIKLWSGEVYENCWPNANTFHEGVIGKVIDGKDVAYIRGRAAHSSRKTNI